MATSVMTGRTTEASPKVRARVAGLLSLLTLATGVFAQMWVSGSLVVFDDAAATAANILGHKSFFQLGFAVYLVEMACQIAATAVFYELLKPVNRGAALVSAYLGLAGCVIKTFGRLFYIAPLFILGGVPYLGVFTADQLRALALLFLKVNDRAAAIGLVFFGFAALLKAYLIIRSSFLPRILGWLAIPTGLGLLTDLYQPLGYRLFPIIAALGLLATVPQIVWLLVVGVNEQRWKDQASLAPQW